MAVPAALYLLLIPAGPWSHGWGVPMPTDTAFAVALLVMMGNRVPVELRIFLTAAAIVDDIGTIAVVALFYSSELHLGYLAAATAITAGLALLNQSRVYSVTPYILLGIALWACVHEGGLHATLAGVILALFVPTRPPADLNALMVQANTIIAADRGTPTKCCGTGRRCRHCARWMRSTTALNRRRTDCCGMPARARTILCCRCSRWRMRAS